MKSNPWQEQRNYLKGLANLAHLLTRGETDDGLALPVNCRAENITVEPRNQKI